MAEANGGTSNNGGGGNGGAPQFNPVEARTYLQTFGHDVTGIDDTTLPTVYEKVKTGADTYVNTQLEARLKERGPFAPDWREALANGDEKKLETLKRYASPQAYSDAGFELRTKISKGELKSNAPYPDKGTPEEQNNWRKEQGIPEKPEGYEITPPEGVVFGKEDEPFLDGFKKHAHATNMTPGAVNAAVAWYGEERVRRQEAAAQTLAQTKKETEDALRSEFGTEYRPAMTRIENVVDSTTGGDKDLREAIMNSVGTNVKFAKFMADVAFKINPTGTGTGPGGEGNLGSIEDGIKRIENTMRTSRKTYDKDAKMQTEYRGLLDAYQRQSGKAWGTK